MALGIGLLINLGLLKTIGMLAPCMPGVDQLEIFGVYVTIFALWVFLGLMVGYRGIS